MAIKAIIPWQTAWRQILRDSPSICDELHGRKCHDTLSIEPEWAEVFDAFVDLEVCNKFIAAGGEGSAKSVSAGIFGYTRTRYDLATVHPAPRQIWVVGADFEDATSDWDKCLSLERLVDNLDGESVRRTRTGRDQCSFVTRQGITFKTVSAKDPTKIAREEVDGILGSECSRWEDEAWKRVFDRTRRKPHSWCFVTGSFETDAGPFGEYFKEGQGPNKQRLRSKSLATWVNRHLYPGGRQDPRIIEAELSNPPLRFLERFGGKPAPPKGIVVPNFRRDTHVQSLVPIQGVPVHLAVDPGTLATAILFIQLYNSTIHVLKELYLHGIDQKTAAMMARNSDATRELWKMVGPKGHVMDFAGLQKHFGAPAPTTIWYETVGLSFFTEGRQTEKETKADAVISACTYDPYTGRPKLIVDDSCTGIICELGGGGRHPLAELGMGPWKRMVHADGSVGDIQSKSDHAASALAYYVMHHFGSARPAKQSDYDQPPSNYTASMAAASRAPSSYKHPVGGLRRVY